jgi:hypothetical protein
VQKRKSRRVGCPFDLIFLSQCSRIQRTRERPRPTHPFCAWVGLCMCIRRLQICWEGMIHSILNVKSRIFPSPSIWLKIPRSLQQKIFANYMW